MFLTTFTLANTSHVRAEASGYKNPISTITLDSGYAFDSARAFWRFGQEVDGAVATGFDLLSSTFLGDFLLTRAVLGGVFYWQWNKLEYGYFVANHELGHGARFYAVHGTPVYRWNEEEWLSHIFIFWADGFTRYGDGAQATSDTQYTTQYLPEDFDSYVSAGGMNNSTLYAESIEDQITFGGGGHILQYPGYVRAKEDAATYVDNTDGGQSGDVATVLSDYTLKGYNISANNIKQGSLVSRWASATHWMFIASAVKYLFKADPMVSAFYFGKIRAPDVSHFLTGRGLSYKIKSAYKDDAVIYPFAVEYVYNGDSTLELSFGLRNKQFGLLTLVNSLGGYGLNADYAVTKTDLLEFTLGASYYSDKSLAGSRLIGRYLEGAVAGYEAWGRLSYNY